MHILPKHTLYLPLLWNDSTVAHEKFYKSHHIKASGDGFAMIAVTNLFLQHIGGGKYVNLKPFTNSQNVQLDA